MKKINFRVIHTDGLHSGICLIGISADGMVEITLQELRVSYGSDFTQTAHHVREVLRKRVIEELSNDLDALHYSSILDISEVTEKEESHEKVG